MRRYIWVVLALLLSACYTQFKQTRANVSSNCNEWPAPVAEGQRLVLGPGQTGRFEDLTILFSQLEIGPYGDLIYLTACLPGGPPIDKKFYLTESEWDTRNAAEVASYRIFVDRLQLHRAAAAGDSVANADVARLTLVVTKPAPPPAPKEGGKSSSTNYGPAPR